MRNLSRRRVGAIFAKELHEYRRNGNLIYAMLVLPLAFLIQPVIEAFVAPTSASGTLSQEHSLVYMLAIPALLPAALSSYALVGERLQGTLEPLLSTPVRRDELMLGKALAAFVPAVVLSYLMFGVFVGVVELFAHPGIAPALIQGSEIIAVAVFTPLLAIWAIWVGLIVSTRSNDPRTAAQLSILASLPAVAVTSLVAFDVIPISLPLAIGFGGALVLFDRGGLRVVSAIFDRERLITSTK